MKKISEKDLEIIINNVPECLISTMKGNIYTLVNYIEQKFFISHLSLKNAKFVILLPFPFYSRISFLFYNVIKLFIIY